MPKTKALSGLGSKLPDRVFISHAYDDGKGKDKLLRCLPERVDAVVFPRREPDPRDAVSNGILAEIRSCGGLIYLMGGQSKESLWVNFERDYALRSGLKVFAFDVKAKSLHEDPGLPVPLRIELVVGEDDERRAEGLLKWMKRARSFDFQAKPTHARLKEIPGLAAKLLHDQRIVVWLMDDHVGAVAEYALEIPTEDLYYTYCKTYDAFYTYKESDFENYAHWLSRHSMYVRLNPEWQPKRSEDPDIREFIVENYPIEQVFRTGWAVDLVSKSNEQDIDWNRADDLIVRLTFMLQQSQPFFTDQDEDND